MGLYERSPSESELKILEKKCPSILEEIQKDKQKGTVRIQAFISDAELTRRTIRDRDEVANRDRLLNQRNLEQSRISFLEESKAINENDLKLLAYSKYIKFGYASLIIFAVLGVFFPLTYKWWPSNWLNHYEYAGLGAFGIGLTLTFLYLYLELKNAWNEKVKRKSFWRAKLFL